MSTWFMMGIRNLSKNGRRSVFTVLAVAFGFAAITTFGGFTSYMFRGLEDSFVYAHANGHLSVFKKDFIEKGVLDPRKFLLSAEEQNIIRSVTDSLKECRVVIPELHTAGLVSNGKVSTVFVGVGRDPAAVERVRNYADSNVGRIRIYDGDALTDDVPYGLGLSRGLAERMAVRQGSGIILMATTVDGQMNAMDGEVTQLFDAPLEMLNDKMIYMPLALSQSLYDTESVDRMSLLCHSTEEARQLLPVLSHKLQEAGLDADVRLWEELRVSYTRIKAMFRIIFLFVFSVVLVIVILSVVNTISMTVLERTREIGTLRAMGLNRRGVTAMFAAESLLLGIFGSVAGALLSLAGWSIIRFLGPTWIPPNIPRRVAWEILLVPEYYVLALVFMLVLAVIAAVVPARRASRMLIIDALGHV